MIEDMKGYDVNSRSLMVFLNHLKNTCNVIDPVKDVPLDILTVLEDTSPIENCKDEF